MYKRIKVVSGPYIMHWLCCYNGLIQTLDTYYNDLPANVQSAAIISQNRYIYLFYRFIDFWL